MATNSGDQAYEGYVAVEQVMEAIRANVPEQAPSANVGRVDDWR